MALRASWNVSGWRETGLAFGTNLAVRQAVLTPAINSETGLVTIALSPSPVWRSLCSSVASTCQIARKSCEGCRGWPLPLGDTANRELGRERRD
jgi:hypothetical protein